MGICRENFKKLIFLYIFNDHLGKMIKIWTIKTILVVCLIFACQLHSTSGMSPEVTKKVGSDDELEDEWKNENNGNIAKGKSLLYRGNKFNNYVYLEQEHGYFLRFMQKKKNIFVGLDLEVTTYLDK
jgi:hypothetical protein